VDGIADFAGERGRCQARRTSGGDPAHHV